MADVKSAYACSLCKKQFSNPLFLIKHVDLRHPTTSSSENDQYSEQTLTKIPVLDDKGTETETINTVSIENSMVIENEASCDTLETDNNINENQSGKLSHLETNIDNENTNNHFKFVDINDILRYEQ